MSSFALRRLLKTEPSIAEELAKLQQMRSALKAVALADNDIRLDTGFANRVIDKAVVRARAEGVSDDHPLMRLDQQPMASLTPVPASSTWRIAAVMVGLAASIAIAVVLMRANEDGVVRVPDPQIVEVKPEMPVRVTPQGTELQPAINTSIASSQTGSTLVEPLSPSPMIEKPTGGRKPSTAARRDVGCNEPECRHSARFPLSRRGHGRT